MKNKFTTILLLLFITSFAQAQQCGMTPQMSEEMLQRTRKNIETLRMHPAQQRDLIYLPITFHVVNREDGLDTLSTDKILNQLCQINNIYYPDFQFYIKAIDKIVNSSIYYEHYNTTFLMSSYIDSSSINVWITENAAIDASSFPTPAGYYSPQNNWIVMDKDYIDMGETSLPHELGHLLGLPHTSGGCASWVLGNYIWENNSQIPDSITLGCALELQDGSNCETAGDLICDTPPDYNFGFGWPDCNFTLSIADQHGEIVHPMEENLMGSFIANNCVADDFTLTPMQIDLIHVYLDELPPFATTTDEPLIGTPNPISPEEGEVTETYDNLYFEWEAVQGATKYILEIGISSSLNTSLPYASFEITGTNSAIISADFITANKKYYWRVRAFNQLHTCMTNAQISSFRTGIISNAPNITEVEYLGILPNPIKNNDLITIKAISSNTFEANIQLFDVKGCQIGQTLQYDFPLGQTQIQLPYQTLQSGLYFLKITNAHQQITKKVMVID